MAVEGFYSLQKWSFWYLEIFGDFEPVSFRFQWIFCNRHVKFASFRLMEEVINALDEKPLEEVYINVNDSDIELQQVYSSYFYSPQFWIIYFLFFICR